MENCGRTENESNGIIAWLVPDSYKVTPKSYGLCTKRNGEIKSTLTLHNDSQKYGSKSSNDIFTRKHDQGVQELLGGGVGHEVGGAGVHHSAQSWDTTPGSSNQSNILRTGQAADRKGGAVKQVVEMFEAENKQDVATKEVDSKVKEMASKLGVKLKNGKKVPAARKKYKQGARVMKQEVELGIQPLIQRFLNGQGLQEHVHGGQLRGVGGGGGGCSTVSPRKRSVSEC